MTTNINQEQQIWSFATKDILDHLPQAWTRGLLYCLIAFISIALPWAMLSTTDQTGVATGRLEPNGDTVKLDAEVSGTVAHIYVQEGDTVSVGQPILAIDAQLAQTDLQQALKKLEGENSRLTQLRSLYTQTLLSLTIQQQQNHSQELEKQAQIAQAQGNLTILKNNYDLQVAQKSAQIAQASAVIQTSQTNTQILQAQLETANVRLKRRQQLLKAGAVSQEEVDEKTNLAKESQRLYAQSQGEIRQNQQHLLELQKVYEQTIKQGKSDIAQAQLKLQEQQQNYQSLKHSDELALLKIQQQLKNTQTDISATNSEIAQTQTQIQALQIQLSQRVLKATTNGTIFQLPIKKPGVVLQPGTRIAEIAPQGSHLILRAQMPTSQNRALKKGLPVKLKFDAYPYQDYGFVLGMLTKISPTSTEVDTANGKATAYQIEVELAQKCILKRKECISLHPGDTATAEVVIGQRRVIDYVLEPLKTLGQDGLKI